MKERWRSLSLLVGAHLLVGCGGASPPPSTSVRWESACDGPPRTRLERFRQLALEHDGTDLDVAALRAWYPRGRAGASRARPVAEGSRGVAVALSRRAVAACGLEESVALTRAMVAFQTVAAIEDNPEMDRMAAWLEDFASEAGLRFRVHGEHDAWEIELPGEGAGRRAAVVTHADVVPVNDPPTLTETGEGWSVPPFDARIAERDGHRVLYGRGTEDDKGPIASTLLALATMADAGIVPAESLLLVAGTAEEHDWDGMERYAAEAPRADHVISLDAQYPVVIAESGFVAWSLALPESAADEGDRLIAARGGLFLTQIPDQAEVTLRGTNLLSLRAAADAAGQAATEELGGRVETVEVDHEGARAIRVVAHGRSAHSSVPEEGVNALWVLARTVSALRLRPSGMVTLLRLVADRFAGRHDGSGLGLAQDDALMGPLVASPTVLRLEEGQARLRINMRRPRGLTADAFRERLDQLVVQLREVYGAELSPYLDTYVGEPHVAEGDEALVTVLQEVYASHTGEDPTPVSIRGGTYARLFEGAVSFGPSFPGVPYAGHGADEFIRLEALARTNEMIFDALERLGR